jgi:hypothetical protein
VPETAPAPLVPAVTAVPPAPETPAMPALPPDGSSVMGGASALTQAETITAPDSKEPNLDIGAACVQLSIQVLGCPASTSPPHYAVWL